MIQRGLPPRSTPRAEHSHTALRRRSARTNPAMANQDTSDGEQYKGERPKKSGCLSLTGVFTSTTPQSAALARALARP